MYENRHGRFTAVDPLLASGKSANPQTFNRYAYVGSNPLIRTDPTGKDWYFNSDGRYRWSSDNRYFDIFSGGSVGELINPTSVMGWTRVQLDENGEHRYPTQTAPGVSTEIILRNSIFWSYGKSTIVDQAAYDAHIKEKLEFSNNVLEGIRSINEYHEMDNALRPLTTTRTGSNPSEPGRLGFTFFEIKGSINRPRTDSPLITDRSASSTNPIATGSYLHRFESGKFYAGKGPETRMRLTGRFYSTTYDDPLVSSKFFPANSNRDAFMNEHLLMMENGRPLSLNPLSPTYNKILSPGCRFFCD